ncbi:NADH-ubiquinone oxidoreductase chain 1 [Armadillidium vulgare]|nr:NADH-ubiquinone oxidoreductase chain 1 [Armadillidium vulgare]
MDLMQPPPLLSAKQVAKPYFDCVFYFLFIHDLTPFTWQELQHSTSDLKFMRYIQKRKGPNKLGFKGILQPFSDAVKLLVKESLLLNLACSNLTNLIIFMNHLSFFPRRVRGKITNYLYFMLFISWGLPNPRLGLRAVAQTISYEVRLAILLLSLVKQTALLLILLKENLSLYLDLTQSIAQVDLFYFSLAEYRSILFISLFFRGGVDLFLNLSFLTSVLVFLFIWVRGTLPRLHYDKLIELT